MKIEALERGMLVLREVFNGVMFETEEGQRLIVCMRDGAFEIAINEKRYNDGEASVFDWYSANDKGIKLMLQADRGSGE